MDDLGIHEQSWKWARAFACSRFVQIEQGLQFAVSCSKIKTAFGGKFRHLIEGSRDPKIRRLTSPSAKPSSQLVLHLTNLVNDVGELLKRLNRCVTPVLFVDSRW